MLATFALAVEDPPPFDRGRFIVFESGQPVATERFAYTYAGDSLLIEVVHSRLMRDADGNVSEFKKSAGLMVDRLDHGLIRYLSNQHENGALTVVGTQMSRGDTIITVFREDSTGGGAEALSLPPGRVYVVDPLMFTMFDVICRSLGRQTFESRPISLITLGVPPRAVEVMVTRTPRDTLVWGGKPVVTTRLTFQEELTSFRAWVNRDGQMLRFEANDGQLRVEREPPLPAPPKKRAASR